MESSVKAEKTEINSTESTDVNEPKELTMKQETKEVKKEIDPLIESFYSEVFIIILTLKNKLLEKKYDTTFHKT